MAEEFAYSPRSVVLCSDFYESQWGTFNSLLLLAAGDDEIVGTYYLATSLRAMYWWVFSPFPSFTAPVP